MLRITVYNNYYTDEQITSIDSTLIDSKEIIEGLLQTNYDILITRSNNKNELQ